jgi:hypothetical protein
MSNQPSNCETREFYLKEVREELLELILQEEVIYPWNPAEPEAEAYFAGLEQEFVPLEESDLEAITPQAEHFFSQLGNCWSSWETTMVRKSLFKRFGECVPHDWLEAIATQAREIFSTALSPADQLVQCVKPLLSDWAEEDLYVFARPVALAMRSSFQPTPEITNWEQLSPIEQARYTMNIAQYALMQLESEPID